MAILLTFTDEKPSQDYIQKFEGFLYNQEKYLQLNKQLAEDRLSYYGLSQNEIYIQVHFFKTYVDNEKNRRTEVVVFSLIKSPFGSFEFNEAISENQLIKFINYVLKNLSNQQVDVIRIQHYASCYHTTNTELLKKCLIDAGFSLGNAMVNHHINVDDASFSEKIHNMEKRRLEKCKKANFKFVEEKASNWPAVYDFIVECRKEKDRKLSLSFAEMEKSITQLGGVYRFFSVFDGDKRVAATIAVIVNSEILYNFLPASLLEYSNYSPIVFLLEGLYEYCISQSKRILDLGTSISEPLRRFKVNVGGEPSLKLEFIYRLTQTR